MQGASPLQAYFTDVGYQMTPVNLDTMGFTPVEENRFLRMVLDAAPGMIAYWDKNLRCRYANSAYLDWFGIKPETLIGMHIATLLGARLFKLNEQYILGALDGKRQCFERTLTKADGSIGYTLANYMPDFDEAGNVMGFSVLISDVTPLKLAEFQTERAQARLQNVLDNVADCIITFEGDWTISSINSAGLRMFGYQASQLLGRQLQFLIPALPCDADRSFSPCVGAETIKLTGLKSDGHPFPIELSLSEVKAPGDTLHVAMIHDITLQQRVEEQLTRLAMTDGLTGLANRRHFDEVLAFAMNAQARSGKELSLLLIDVDFFKQYNDHYGHIAGDDCLRRIAGAIRRVITRTNDLAARYGGEEFACILPMTDLNGAVMIAREIQEEVARLGVKHARSSAAEHVTVSIGIAIASSPNELSVEDLIRQADAQLYAAKKNGRNQLSFALPGHYAAPRAEGPVGYSGAT